MPALDRLIFSLEALLAAIAVAGLVLHRRASACWGFVAYLAATAAFYGLVATLPARFWTWPFSLLTDVLQTTLRAACAIEIAERTFRALPRGRAQMRWLFAAGALLIIINLAFWQGRTDSAFDLTLLVARVTYGVAFLFAAYLRLTSYYHLPVDPIHRDVAVGFVVLSVLVAFTQPLSALDAVFGWGRDTIVKVAYPVLLSWWAYRAWAAEAPSALTREVMERYQPWRVTRVDWTRRS